VHGRVDTLQGATNLADGRAYLTADVLPLLRRQSGYRGGMASIDESAGVPGLISLWEDGTALEASERAAAGSRSGLVRLAGGDVTVETFDQVVSDIGRPPPEAGCLVRFVQFRLDPSLVGQTAAFFESDIRPAISMSPGFRAVRNFTDASTGRGLTAIIVSDAEGLTAAEAGFEARRESDEAHGIRFGEIADRKVLLVDRLTSPGGGHAPAR
jgi:hypothetical protein